MAVYGGDVGLDEFAKHPNARLLWETAQGRVTWDYDLAVWSSHDGEDTLFNQFAQQARALHPPPFPLLPLKSNHNQNPPLPWNLYFRVTMPDAIELGLLDIINRARGTNFTPDQFLADCRARAGSEEIFQQSYLCNPLGAATASIVEWSAIERCRADYQIERLHLEADQVLHLFGQLHPALTNSARERKSTTSSAPPFPTSSSRSRSLHRHSDHSTIESRLRLGFDVAASGQGDLAAIYIDEARGHDLWLRALFTCRTEDWHFLGTVLFYFLEDLRTHPGRRRRVRPRPPNLLGSRQPLRQPLPQSQLRLPKNTTSASPS